MLAKTLEDKAYYIHEKITSPKAFSLSACIGVIATTVLAIYVTKKECEKEKEETQQEKSETVIETAKAYAPVIAAAVGTIWCIKKSDAKWQAYNGLINSAFISAQDKMARYRSQVPGVVAGSLVSGLGGRTSDEGKQWFCLKDMGPYEDIYFQATEADIAWAEYHLNRNFTLRGSASVREFCAFLGIEDQIAREADYYGWDTQMFFEGDLEGIEPWIDFEHYNTADPETGEVIGMITFTWSPGFSEDHELLAYGYGA